MEFPRDFGNYTLLAELGRGGMGIVYRADQKTLGRPVALKVLNVSGDWASEEILARFRREGEVMARLAHPDIVTIFDFGVVEDRPFIAMELVRGMPFDRWFRSNRPPLPTSLAILARVARAVHHAHAQGIIHRDIKPSNILVDSDGNPKLTDFGLAKIEGGRGGLTGGLIGSPAYMSPEQAGGETSLMDVRTDVYGLGAVMYEILTGSAPFWGATLEAIVRKVIDQEPVAPRTFDQKLPEPAETICLKALEKSRVRRYPTALAFAEDVERFLRGESILARPAGLGERVRRWIARNRVSAAAAAVAAILGGSLAAVGLALSSRIGRTESASREKDDLAEADALFRRAQYAEALDRFARLGDRPEIRLKRAICLRETGARDAAEREFAAVVEAIPQDASAWRHRALNMLEAGRLGEAVRFYREAAALARVPFAQEADDFADYDALIAFVERHYVALEPQHARVEIASAAPHFDFGLRNDFGLLYQTELPDPYATLADWSSRFSIRRYPNVPLETWIRKYGEHPALLGWRAASRLASDPRSALEDADRAIAAVPNSRWLYYLRFRSLYSLGRKAEAEGAAEALRILCPNDLYTRWNLAQCRKKGREFARAARDFEALIECERRGRVPTVATARWYVEAAECAARAGNAAETVRLVRAARAAGSDRFPENPEAYERNPLFASVLVSPEFQEFLDSLDPLPAATHRWTTREVLPDPWAGCGAGSSARYKLTIEADGKSSVWHVLVVLGTMEEHGYTMSCDYLQEGRGTIKTLLYDLPRRASPPAGVQVGEETIRVPYGTFACRWAKVAVPGGFAQIWWNEEVPFRLVRRVYRLGSRTATLELYAYEKR